MIDVLLLSLALATADSRRTLPPCRPAVSDRTTPTPPGFKEHHALRYALGEPMPQAPTMVMLLGKGGHLSTQEYSVIVVRGADGRWRGTAVGRSQIWIEGAPFSPIPQVAWTLGTADGRLLDRAIARTCPHRGKTGSTTVNAAPPPLNTMVEQIDIVTPGRAPIAFHVAEDDEALAASIRPPQ